MLAAAVVVALISPVHLVDPGGRAALETMIVVAALSSAGLLRANLQQSGEASDALLLCAVIAVALTDFIYRTGPALSPAVMRESQDGFRPGLELVVSFAFAAAAFAPIRTVARPTPSFLKSGLTAAALALALGLLAEWLAGSSAPTHETALVAHRVAVSSQIGAAGILIVAATAFVAHSRRDRPDGFLLGGACVLFAGAALRYIQSPTVATDWVTPNDWLRLGAYALLLQAAYRRYARTRHRTLDAAVSCERERIARDLHDGLAQDLACIATEGQRLETGVGPEHPLMIATRRALDASRGAITDLWASTAPSTEAALRLIADELEHRFDVEIAVRMETSTQRRCDDQLTSADREHVVRIVREAIVNAVLHGIARHVDVEVLNRGEELLVRVSDDGHGIGDALCQGFGWRTMRARADSLGGELSAHRRADGGTALELIVP